jgi:hypothetical protein
MSQPPNPGQYPEQPQSGPPQYGQPQYGQPQYGQPYPGQPGQPYQGQPNPDVPTSVPPQPGFPPPMYGQQPGYPVYGQPTPPPKKSRALPITLIAIAVVLVLCVGGGTATFLLVRNTAENVADSVSTAAPTIPPADPTTDPTPTEAAKTITIVEPKRLGGRPKLTDKQFAGIADQLQSELGKVPGATNTVGALYGTPAERDLVIIAAVEAPIASPKRELDGTFLGAGVGGLKVTGITEVEPGPLGGEASCGKTESAGVDMAFCAWADEGSVGWIMWYFKSVKQVSTQFAKLRGEIEKSS